MAKAFVPKYYFPAIIKGYVIESSKDGKYTFEKIVVQIQKQDGSYQKESKINVTTGDQTCLKGLQPHLEAVLGTPMDKWDTLVGKELNIPVKLIRLRTILDPEGFPEFVTHGTKPTILLANATEPVWTDEEIERMRPKGKVKSMATPMSTEAPVVNTSDDF
jgi:hypothetical protein